MGYSKRGTLGGFASGGAKAAAVKIERCNVPKTPWWSRKVVGRVDVSSA